MYPRLRYCCCYARTTGQFCFVLLKSQGIEPGVLGSMDATGTIVPHYLTLTANCGCNYCLDTLLFNKKYYIGMREMQVRILKDPAGISPSVKACVIATPLRPWYASPRITSHHIIFYIYVGCDWLLRLIANIWFYCLTCGDTFLRNDRLW